MLSVVTITRNDPEGLAKTRKSLGGFGLNRPWEWLIIDSSDIQVSVPEARLVSAEPRGIYAAMNEGIEASRGEVLLFLNGGDEVNDAEAIWNAYEKMRANLSLEVHLGGALLTRQGKGLYRQLPNGNLRSVVVRNRQICHQAILFRRTLFQRVGMFNPDLKLLADYEFYWRALNTNAYYCNRTWVNFDATGVSNRSWLAWREKKQIAAFWSRRQLSRKEWGKWFFRYVPDMFMQVFIIQLRTYRQFDFLRGPWLRWRKFQEAR